MSRVQFVRLHPICLDNAMPRFSDDEAEYTRPPPSQYLALAATAIPAGTAVQVIPSLPSTAGGLEGEPQTGAVLVNTGTVALTYSPVGVAGVGSVPLAIGQVVQFTVPSIAGVSVFCPAGGAAGAVNGYIF